MAKDANGATLPAATARPKPAHAASLLAAKLEPEDLSVMFLPFAVVGEMSRDAFSVLLLS
ncbi:hypothetical protein [Affinirhizobium pseudoryzae]|jgi:hypothetical protein|uniref:hypothetical protein n=1 Tax=Allorhizobium pseudoryzae TaxID=379684 RepID=UPI001F2B954D|nr:hypothetical protein [Allorhizobium pseudoryzae]